MHDRLFGLEGKAAVVTGAGRGIGRAIALGLAERGVKLVLGARSQDDVTALAEEIAAAGGSAHAQAFDAREPDQATALIAAATRLHGRLDIAIVNHGIAESAAAEETSMESWRRTLDINLTGAFVSAQAAAKAMIAQGQGGAIVFTSSTASMVGFPHLLAYGASKGGIDQMVRQMAVEWGAHNIRVNAINPGYTSHAMRGGGDRDSDPPEELLIKMTPMGRRGAAAEMVGPALFLASDAASFVTGVCLPVDGGYCAR